MQKHLQKGRFPVKPGMTMQKHLQKEIPGQAGNDNARHNNNAGHPLFMLQHYTTKRIFRGNGSLYMDLD